MSNTFLASDLHLGHDNIYRFETDGKKLREWATNSTDGDEYIIDRWNSVVNPRDRVYLLGDVVIKRKALQLLDRLNGRKVLIKGNHDIFKLKYYTKYFDDIRGSQKLDTFILTHIPIHPMNIPHWCKANIHGHTHTRHVLLENGMKDDRYFNVSIEVLPDNKPISFETIRDYYKNVQCS